jgi:hypothetical protein
MMVGGLETYRDQCNRHAAISVDDAETRARLTALPLYPVASEAIQSMFMKWCDLGSDVLE